jgi:hypothetical protein
MATLQETRSVMSIAGYLSAGKREVRMPKKGGDESGIRFDGAVLTGEKSVEERLKMPDAVPSSGEYYERVEDYDPVLRAHCRR